MARPKSETFNHRTSVAEDGTILYDAPIVMRNQADFENYNVTKSDCITLWFGGYDLKRIYFYQTPSRAVAEFFWNELNKTHSRDLRITRCMIPGKQKPLIFCPTSNSCQRCPFGKKPENKQLNTLSWDYMLEKAHEKEIAGNYSRVTEEIDTVILKVDLHQRLDAEDTRLMKILEWKYLDGLSAQDIADRLDCSVPRTYQLLKQALDLTREFEEHY